MATRTEHTPGPWQYRTCYTNGEPVESAVESIHPEHGGPLATVHLTVDNDEQDEANARLIAAAPDLLAALKKATSAIIVAQAHGFDCCGLLEEVEAALAKAGAD